VTRLGALALIVALAGAGGWFGWQMQTVTATSAAAEPARIPLYYQDPDGKPLYAAMPPFTLTKARKVTRPVLCGSARSPTESGCADRSRGANAGGRARHSCDRNLAVRRTAPRAAAPPGVSPSWHLPTASLSTSPYRRGCGSTPAKLSTRRLTCRRSG